MDLDCERGASCGVFLQNLSRRLSGHELSEASAVFAVSLSCVSSRVDLSYFYIITYVIHMCLILKVVLWFYGGSLLNVYHLGRCFLLVIITYLKCHLFIEEKNIFSVKRVTCILLRFLSNLCRFYCPPEMLNALMKMRPK